MNLLTRLCRAPFLATILVALIWPLTLAAQSSWTVKREVKVGQTVDMQTMYNINRRTCKWQKIPPVPKIQGKVKLGSISFSTGKTKPHQCPEIQIDANFAKYTAGAKTGKDRFTIKWKSTESQHVFTVRYIIDVQ